MTIRTKRNIRAVGGRTVHSGDPRVSCGFRDKIAPDKREVVDLPINCKVELGYERQPGDTNTPEPEPIEREDQDHAPEPEPERVDEDQAEPADASMTELVSIIRPASPIVGVGEAIADLGDLVRSVESNTPAAFGKALERIGLDLIRVGMRAQEIL